MIFLFSVLISLSGFAQESQEPYENCYGDAERLYHELSEKMISLYETAQVDRNDFEKYRAEIISRRESDLLSCLESENKQLKNQVKVLSETIRNGEFLIQDRSPASFNPAFEEIQPTED